MTPIGRCDRCCMFCATALDSGTCCAPRGATPNSCAEESTTRVGALRASRPTNANRLSLQPSLRPTCPRRSRPAASRDTDGQPAGPRRIRGGRLFGRPRLARGILPPLWPSRSQAYRQTPDHVHLILTPQTATAWRRPVAGRRLYAGFVNARARQTGHLFQGRFGSVALDEEHLMNAARYVPLNPVRARLVLARHWPH